MQITANQPPKGGAGPRVTDIAAPLCAAELQSALARLGAPRRAILAVSGGPDSMALARLAAQGAAAGGGDVLAVTVDHRLRPGSRAEAEQAGRWCRAAGLAHRILAWEGPKPSTGIQAAARAERYRLLAGLAAGEGYDAILTAHTAGDQAETVFMRLARGAGPRGLAGMEARIMIAAGPLEPVLLLRPFLEFPRARIIATLDAFGQDFIADPSNDDPGFERVRTRALLAALAEQGLLTTEALWRTAARMRAAAARLEASENAFFEEAGGAFGDHGWASLAQGEENPPPPGLIARLIRAVGGGDHLPAEDAAAGALAAATEGRAASLGGAILKKARGRLTIYREPAAVLGRAGLAPLAPASVPPGGAILWDGRFIIANQREGPLAVAPIGEGAPGRELAAALGVPPGAVQAAPAIVDAQGAASLAAADAPGLTVQSLAAERFSGRTLRFH